MSVCWEVASSSGSALSRALFSCSDWLIQALRPGVGDQAQSGAHPASCAVGTEGSCWTVEESGFNSLYAQELSLQLPCRVWSPPKLVSSGYQGQGMKPTIHPLIPRVRTRGLYLHSHTSSWRNAQRKRKFYRGLQRPEREAE